MTHKSEELAGLPIYVLDDRLQNCVQRIADATAEKNAVMAAILLKYADQIRTAAAEKPTGISRLADGEYEIVIDRPKKVTWDQGKLAAIRNMIIREWGEDSREYITETLNVTESRYKAWPESLRADFNPARTVTPGNIRVTIEKKDK